MKYLTENLSGAKSTKIYLKNLNICLKSMAKPITRNNKMKISKKQKINYKKKSKFYKYKKSLYKNLSQYNKTFKMKYNSFKHTPLLSLIKSTIFKIKSKISNSNILTLKSARILKYPMYLNQKLIMN
jgi:hypothetical protein